MTSKLSAHTCLRLLSKAALLVFFISIVAGSCGGEGNSAGSAVSGRVITPDGVGLEGVIISVTADVQNPDSGCGSRYQYTAITDVDGFYIFYTGSAGEGRITPSKTGYVFSPSDRTVNTNGSDSVRNQDFVAIPGQLVSIAVTPISATITRGATQQFTATGTFSDNSTRDLSTVVLWSSSDPTKANINSAGLATGINVGSVTISATLMSFSKTSILTVMLPVVPWVWATASAGYSHTAAIKLDGTLWAWGDNSYGQLGDGTNFSRTRPVQIGTGADWKLISAGGTHAAAALHTTAIKTDHTLWAWGSNYYGQLGDGTMIDKSTPAQIGSGTNWKSVSAGGVHTTALQVDGTLWAWGANDYGQLGDGSSVGRSSPVRIGADTDWACISTGSWHSAGIKTNGTLWSWGANSYGQLGDGTNTNKNVPAQVGIWTDWLAVAAGDSHTVAVRSDGTLWAWGANSYGQLGDGTTVDKNEPVQVGADKDWVSVAAGDAHTTAIKTDGSLWSWGINNRGQLGDGTSIDKHAPVMIGTSANWKSVAIGDSHTAVVTSDGTLWTWGANYSGELGDGTTTDKFVPINIP